jgi:hypothetical protein
MKKLADPSTTRMALGLRVCCAVIRELATDQYAHAGLSESEMRRLLSAYLCADMAAHVLQIMSFRLIGMEYPSWMKAFYGLEPNYGGYFLPGLVLSARHLRTEEILWVDTDFGEDSRITKYLYAPSAALIRHEQPLTSRDVLLTAIVPQLIAMVVDERLDCNICTHLLKYPEQFYIRVRGECFFDPETLSQPQHAQAQWRQRLRVWCRDRITERAFDALGLADLASRGMNDEDLLAEAEWRAFSRTGIDKY